MEETEIHTSCSPINNEIYHQLGERWYTAQDDPIALLRAEAKCRNPWIIQSIQAHLQNPKPQVLDVGCGAGFLSNPLAQEGYSVTGMDLSKESLAVAKRHDSTQSVNYLLGSAEALPFENSKFDVVCAMDLLEHVTDPQKVIQEMARVLKPEGLLFFHTFNRNVISSFVVIKLVEWFIKNTPPKMHVSDLFIKPEELKEYCRRSHLEVVEMRGLLPRFFQLDVIKGLLQGEVKEGFRFEFGKSLLTGYCGYSKKYAI